MHSRSHARAAARAAASLRRLSMKPVKLHGMDKIGLRRRLSLDDEIYSYSMIPLPEVARADLGADLSHQVMGNQHTPPHIMASMESYCPDLAQSTIINFPSGEKLKHTVSWHHAKKLGQNLRPSSDNRPRRAPPSSCPKKPVKTFPPPKKKERKGYGSFNCRLRHAWPEILRPWKCSRPHTYTKHTDPPSWRGMSGNIFS
jgi:hypothetical protein